MKFARPGATLAVAATFGLSAHSAVGEGLEAIFADYESRGISNARKIHEALNR